MPKKIAEFLPSQEDRLALEQLAQNRMENPRVVERARILLACADKRPIDEIAAEFQVSRSMVFRWRARYLQDGMAGLWDKPRTGKPPHYDEEFKKQVLQALSLPPPDGKSQWDGQSLARFLGASDDAVWRLLRRYGISLARQRVWSVKTPVPFPYLNTRLAGLFIAPPVWIMAQRSPQKLPDSARGYTRNRMAGNNLIQAEKKAGILDLQHSLQIMAQASRQLPSHNKRREEMFNFLNDILLSTLPGQHLTFLVLGNATALEVSSWMAAHQEVQFRFFETMKDAQMLLDQKKAFMNTHYEALIRQIMDYPADAPPFIWKTLQHSPEE